MNETWFKIPRGKEGTYRGQCAELCGIDHADMRAKVRAVTPDSYELGQKSAKTSGGRRGTRRAAQAAAKEGAPK